MGVEGLLCGHGGPSESTERLTTTTVQNAPRAKV